jgi:hypothetical protein
MPFRIFYPYVAKPIRHSLLKIKNPLIFIQLLAKRSKKKTGKVSSGISVSGSLTVESAFVLPIFLFGMLALISYLDVLCVQVRITASLCESGKKLGIYAYGREDTDNITASILTREAGCAYAKSRLEKDLSGVRLTGLTGGMKGISLGGSYMDSKKIKLQAKYTCQFPVFLFPAMKIPMISSCTVRAWNGYDGSYQAELSENTSGEMVYLTDWESVYHREASCSHLQLSVTAVDIHTVGTKRNLDGSRYKPCEKCIKQAISHGNCYITEQGDRYHASRTCSGLTRNIRLVPLEEVSGLRVCSRCG